MSDPVLNMASSVLIGNYARLPVVMQRGEGCFVYDTAGRRYIDLFAGFGGGIVGHCHPRLVEAVTEQAKTLWHVGNQFHTEPQTRFAKQLQDAAFDGRAFFCHSGLEANEAAVKLARLRGLANGGKRWKTISLLKSFHGRSLAMIAATGNPAVKEGFGPPVPGFSNVDPLDFDAITAAIDDETCCIIMEPIQGEGGVNLYPEGHVKRIRDLCDERGLSLIFDEVWTGCGRTGKWFGHQHFDGITPDIMTLGKAVGGGLPVGAMYARTEVARLLTPGKHGCTLGGNPICMAAASAVFETIEKDNLLQNATELGRHAMNRLSEADELRRLGAKVRGRGLFIGIELVDPFPQVVERALSAGVIVNVTATKVIRIAPPINIDKKTLDQGIDLLLQSLV